MNIFKEAIHEDDELAHAGRYGDERFFTSAEQALIKFFKDAVIPHGAQGGHVECLSDGTTAATDGTTAFEGTAVTVIRSQPGQGRNRLFVERSQFGHLGQNRGGDDGSNARNGLQPAGFIGQLGVLSDERGNGFVALVDLFFQETDQLPTLATRKGIGVMFGMVAFDAHQANQLLAALRPVCQLLLLGRSWRSWGWLEGLTIFGQDGRIDGVGFGSLALGASEMANPASFQNADWDAGGLQSSDDALFVTTSGFTNDLSVGMSAQVLKELSMTFGVIGQSMEMTGQMELQRELGNVQADVEDVGVVLTHTCRIRATIFKLSCSSNGSSLGQWARAKRAPGRITLGRMLGLFVSARAVASAPAGAEATSSCCFHSEEPRRTKERYKGWRTLAGDNDRETLRPEGALESTVGYRPIRPIRPIRLILRQHSPTISHPKSTLAHPKSTVDLGFEPLIKVENGLRSPLSQTSYRPISGPKIKESNQNQTAAHQKIYSAYPVSGQNSPHFSPSYSNLFHPLPTYSTHFDPPRFLPDKIKNPYSSQFFRSKLFKAVQSHSRIFRNIFLFLCARLKNPVPL